MPPITFIIGLSGPSSSGKTTLARLLRSIFHVDAKKRDGDARPLSLFILHEDDFYKTDAEIPTRTITSPTHGTRTLQDWDCVESLDLPLLQSTLSHLARHGTIPPDMVSKEDQNSVGESGVDDAVIEDLKVEVENWWHSLTQRAARPREREAGSSDGNGVDDGGGGRDGVRICILDGFLLYPPPPSSPSSQAHDRTDSTNDTNNADTNLNHTDFPITSLTLQLELHTILSSLLSQKLFLLSSRTQTIRRRSNRTGYVTLEGFWADPPGYVEDVVWPNYVRDHGWMFRGGVVDGPVRPGRGGAEGGGSGGGEIDGGVDGKAVGEGDGDGNKAEERGNETGEIDEAVVRNEGIMIAPGRGNVALVEVLRWAVRVIEDGMGKRLRE